MIIRHMFFHFISYKVMYGYGNKEQIITKVTELVS